MRIMTALLALLLVAALAGCGEDEVAEAPPPQELTREATGHYCGMIVADHRGPKGQIHLAGTDQPVWFSSVRDTLAFTRLPEEPKTIRAIYVNDMGRASWDAPESGTWIEARQAWYVIGSARRGGMGAPETVPFAEKTAAERFAAAHGGRVVAFADIPDEFILGDAGAPQTSEGMGHMDHGTATEHQGHAPGMSHDGQQMQDGGRE
ncbi:MAG: nitrous oxide reductase accessory protein NosL [Alphaproteobacteria bacterium]|nr:nitrous oxide reductase accessory protein NosL [Alphaproteobacteria bacterium]